VRRLSERHKRWLAHRHRYEAKRRQRKRGYRLVSVTAPTAIWTARAGGKIVSMPSVLCFDQNSAMTLEALADLRRALHIPLRGTRSSQSPSKHRGGRQSWLGRDRAFETIQQIAPAAALVLAAEYERLFYISRVKPFVANIENWNSAVLDTLFKIGFSKSSDFPMRRRSQTSTRTL